ncbi:MAG: hypothetical protein EHM48_00435 [Planctomycetaceae bacterium]|nr:MAG: hypothetical protein EHM48_00435 [Planctomycetaceae bacterium]
MMMMARTGMWRIVLCAIGVALCAISAGQVYAASGRALAVGRAFSYAYNNPQLEPGQGPLGSSIYGNGGGNSNYIQRPATYMPSDSPLNYSLARSTPYSSMVPLALTSAGPSVGTSSNYSFGDSVRQSLSVLAAKDAEGLSIETPPLTSLAPATPGALRDAMLRGELAFRAGNYDDALKSFLSANTLSKDSPETMLSLAQTYFAMGDKSYAQAAQNLAGALTKFPSLPLVRVRPLDFFGKADDYKKALANLETYVKANPKDAGTLLLLGYMQYRGGLIDQSLDTLDTALANSPAKELADGISALLEGISRTGKVILAGAPPMDKPADYAWAGIRLAMPVGMSAAPLATPNEVLTGMIQIDKSADMQQVTLYAYPLGDGSLTLNVFMDFMMNSIRQSPMVKDFKVEVESEVPFQTGKALVRVMSYSSGSDENRSYMGWVAFIREPKDKKAPRVAYMLGLATTEKHVEKLLPTLAAICKTIVVSDPVAPPPAKIDLQGNTVEDTQLNFSIVQPVGWAGRPTDRGFEMGQMDFADGGAVSPKVSVIVQTVPADQTPKTLIEAAIERKAPKGMVRKVLTQGPAKMSGMDAYQVVGSQTPEEGSTGASSVIVCRVACVDLPDGSKRLYALVVECRGATAGDTETMAEKIAAGIKVQQPAKADTIAKPKG